MQFCRYFRLRSEPLQEPPMRFELMTSPLPRERSTPELRRQSAARIRAGQIVKQWAGLDSNQCRLSPANLQSAPFSHSGTDPTIFGC